MNRNIIKKFLITIVGALTGYISLLGFYPFGVAYLAAGYTEKMYRWALFPLVMAGMAFSAAPLQIVKYGLAMVVVMCIISLAEKNRDKCPVWVSGSVAGIVTAIMQAADYIMLGREEIWLVQVFAETLLIISMTVIFKRIIEDFMAEREEEEQPVVVYNPGKEKIEESAKAFRNLANTFYSMPRKKEGLSKEDLDGMIQEVSDELCCTCEKWVDCWKVNFKDTWETACNIWEVVEQTGDIEKQEVVDKLESRCIQSSVFLDESRQVFQRAKLNLIWNNRMIENREAVADQLNEMAGIISGVAEEVYEVPETSVSIETQIKMRFKVARIIVQKVVVIERKENKMEVHITMHTAGNRCIATKELEGIVSKICKRRMVSSRDSRSIVNRECCTVIFIDDVNFRTLYGVARTTKTQESISGDNFSFLYTADGQLVMSLSDGMGSGIEAYKESSVVVDLLEQFLEAGFKKETAVKMINSSLVMQIDRPYFSTIDISAVNLYDGVCDFLKVGASTTFIKRDNWVETISSTSLPAGVFHQVDIESISKKLYDGDFVIMVTDGILDSLPIENQEILIQNIIMEADTNNPKKMASHIVEQALSYTNGEAIDDMTVLVTGIWKK